MANAMPSDLEQFVQQELSSGRFPDRDTLLIEAVASLRREREETFAGIQAGLDDVAAGRAQSISQAFEEIRKEFSINSDA